LTKRKRQASRRRTAGKPADRADDFDVSSTNVVAGGLSLHDLFQQQTMALLDRSDLTEEQKQNILVAMNCPCCGAGGLSYTVKLKRKK
jgi:hypothetical protein